MSSAEGVAVPEPRGGAQPGPSSPIAVGQAMLARKRTKLEVVDAYLRKLGERGDIDINAPGFAQSIRQHFDRLPTRYALDVTIDSLDVLSHKRLLDEARSDPSAVSFAVRPVEVVLGGRGHGMHAGSRDSGPLTQFEQNAAEQAQPPSQGSHDKLLPRPAFGSSPNLQALVLEGGDTSSSGHEHSQEHVTFYEITVASADQPKLLSRLSEALSDIGLNIREAHAFNTSDGFSLDVFVVDKMEHQQKDWNLEEVLGMRLAQMPLPPGPGPGAGPGPSSSSFPSVAAGGSGPPPPTSLSMRLPQEERPMDAINIFQLGAGSSARPSSPAPDDWEIDIGQLEIDAKIASGAFSNLYRGYYCGQEVAVKILKDVQDDTSQYQEFLQEVSIMRKVRHKNVVQFIGACTRKPNLCIVFEFMSGGSIYDYMRREGQLQLTQVLRIAAEVARGMDYLHQRKIIHRDLKAANLLMDEHHIVKIADFGVARIIETSGHMTAETGTYRWMAPEVIEHKPYDNKADVFSFGVVLWELLTCRVPYSDMTPLQAAVGVVQKGLRPAIPPNTPPALALLMESCWSQDPAHRPTFRDLTPRLQQMMEAARDEDSRRLAAAAAAASKPPSSGGLLSKLRGKG